MKKGLSQICLGRQSLVRDGLALCRELDYAGLEILLTESGELTLASGPEEYAALRRMSAESGVALTGVVGGGSLTDDDPRVVARSKAELRKCLEAAAALGVDTVLVIGGRVTEQVAYDTAYARLFSALQELRADAERHRVSLALENIWNKLLLSPLELRGFLDDLGSPYIGAFFDVGNVLLYGYPEQWIRILGRRIKKVHFKDFRFDRAAREYAWTQLMEGQVDWPAVMRELRAIGYDDYVISEVDGDRDTFAATSRAMDRILALP